MSNATVARYNKFVKNMGLDREEMENQGMDFDDVIGEAIHNILEENDWVVDFMLGRGVIDVAGRVADDIATCNQIDS